uniref:RING-type domain-containing protein n=1 Tax=Panagrellus redivivus TaxID=6233 RepID=A0A7E4UST6_PANRE
MTSDVDLSECCICYDTYDRTDRAPISMGCGHTFCQSCVGRLVSNKSFSCPVCRTVSTVGMDGFQKSLTLIRALEKLNLLPSDGTDENRPSTSSASKVVPSKRIDTKCYASLLVVASNLGN